MNTNMNGKPVQRIWFNGANGDENITADAEITLALSATHHGDRDEFWVVVYEGGVEVARHNCRYIASIEWRGVVG